MEYTSNQLAKLSGVTTRTLRHYDAIGLLHPARTTRSNYRLYTQTEVERLQQILFYKTLGFPLNEIKQLLDAQNFNKMHAFECHLSALKSKQAQLHCLIENVTKSIAHLKGEYTMSDKEKFEGFKQEALAKNEAQYGEELRQSYGTEAINASQVHFKNLSQAKYEESEALRHAIEDQLPQAIKSGDPSGPLAQEVCALHQKWLTIFYPNYSKAYHKGLAELYQADERFQAHYDKIAPGATAFLCAAIEVYCEQAE